MKRVFPIAILLSLTASGGLTMPLAAQNFTTRGEQDKARRDLLDGHVMPFSVIKRRVEQTMGKDASYVGMAPSPRRGIYRMQFLRKDGVVIWVDVDGKTGDIVARTK